MTAERSERDAGRSAPRANLNEVEQRMRRTTITMAATLAGLMAIPSIASAAVTAITADPVSLRAGPSIGFPVVDRIPDDARVTVFGCVRAYQWCDIAWRDARGWVQGDDLIYLYQQRRVRLIEYGPRIGLPVVVFSFDTYWNRHYRSRPFYTERTRWRTVWRDRDGRRDRVRVDIDRDKTKTERRTDRIERQKDRTERRMDRRDDRSERRLNKQDDRPDRVTRGDRPRRDARPDRSSGPQAEMRDRPARPAPGSAIQRGGRDGGGRDGGPGRGGDGPKDRN
jgi:uncharacterized protein YraI